MSISGQDRFDTSSCTSTMMAMVTTGNGDYDKLVYREVPVPEPVPGEVLLQVLAAGVNNTEINTRLGWYSASVTTSTEAAAQVDTAPVEDGGWSAPTPFPFIQGTDCCGRIVAVADRIDQTMIGTRVLVRSCMRPAGYTSMDNIWMGSDFDGAFAQFVKVPVADVFPMDCDWSDAELATIPCAYGTAENMLHRTRVCKGEHVLVAGASGGVGSAVVQLAKRRGAWVTGIAAGPKADQVKSIGAGEVIDRNDDVVACLGEHSVDVVVDNVAGPAFGGMLNVLKCGGRYASSGAIGGPLVTLEMRTY
jgi:NADPH:quinone reductase-like Zn-dependent oxidoreductase